MDKRRAIREPVAQPLDQSYRIIRLTQGQFAKVSAHRYEYLSNWPWFARWNPHTRTFYAARTGRLNGKNICILMHRVVAELPYGSPSQVDHRNHDTLDNTDENIRIANNSQNVGNSGPRRNNTTGYKGVCISKARKRHPARYVATVAKKEVGRFPVTPEGLIAAALAHDKEAIRHFGEFAHLNFPDRS